MALLIGTVDGVYKARDWNLADVECVLDNVKAYDLVANDGVWYAATVDGLYRSSDGLNTWDNVAINADAVTAVETSPTGDKVYAGTLPADIYVTHDRGHSWDILDSFHDIPSRDLWFNDVAPPNVRGFGVHPDVPEQIIVGIDGGGIYLSSDQGTTWDKRMTGITQYVHDILVLDSDQYIASTDAGVFGTRNSGKWWDYLFDGNMKHRYFRGAFSDGEVIYAGGARSTPGAWKEDGGSDAGLYEIRWYERAPTMKRISYPGEPSELVNCGICDDGQVVAGTTGGRLLRYTSGRWETAGHIPDESAIRTMRTD